MPPEAVATLGTLNPAALPPGASPSADAVRNLPPPPEGLAANGATPKTQNSADALIQSKFAAFMNDVRKATRRGPALRGPSGAE